MPTPVEQRRRETAAKVAALTLANAFIFQEQLAIANAQVRSVRSVLMEQDFTLATSTHWKYICEEINYVPIFQIARDILDALPAISTADDAVRRLAREALLITQNKAALRHDLMGRIYHWLLHDAKYLGTYYTSVSAATLLLKLSLAPDRWPEVDWSDLKQIEKLVIADLACGTGTLLMAAAQAITDNYINASAAKGRAFTEDHLRQLHQALMEKIIHGYDVLPSAVHLTAATLGLLAPEIAFKKMRLYWVPMGKQPSGEVYLGSIDYISSDSLLTQLDLAGEIRTGGAAGAVTGSGMASSTAPLPRMSLCVMNPPFVRSVGGNLLFGSMPRDRADMQKKLGKLLKAGSGKVRASITAGLGSVFAAVADRHLGPSDRISLLIPAAVASGVAWERTRSLIDDDYHLQVFVSSHDAEKWSFSENTDLSEIMLMARKRRAVGTKKADSDKAERAAQHTSFVNLWLNPATIAEGLAAADAVEHTEGADLGSPQQPQFGVAPIMVGGKKIGEKIRIPTSELRGKPWLACAFAQTDLIRALYFLAEGSVYVPGISAVATSVPISTLGSLGNLGPDRRDIYDAFSVGDIATPYPAFWGHDADRVTTIEASTNRWLSPHPTALPGRPLRDSNLIWGRSGDLMIAEKMWLETQKLVAVALANPALSNVWWPFKLHDKDSRQRKALSLWLNSTLGLILFLGNRTPTRGPWVQFKKPVLDALPVLDVRRLDDARLSSLSTLYDQILDSPFQALPAMAKDQNRKLIDKAFSEALALPDVEPLRRALGREPIVSNARLAVQTPSAPAQTDQMSLW